MSGSEVGSILMVFVTDKGYQIIIINDRTLLEDEKRFEKEVEY